jgi:hypothetical protein
MSGAKKSTPDQGALFARSDCLVSKVGIPGLKATQVYPFFRALKRPAPSETCTSHFTVSTIVVECVMAVIPLLDCAVTDRV